MSRLAALEAEQAAGRREEADALSAPWEEPVPLDGTTDLPAFPVEVLPSWLREWVTAEAEALQVPVDLPAMLALAVCAAAVAGRVAVRVRDGWVEPANLYVVVALPPGERKSAVFADATRPIEEREADLARQAAPEIAQAAAEFRMAEAARDRAEAEAARAKPEERASKTAQAIELARALADMTVPAMPRLLTADCTPEALASLLAEQGGRMAVMAPEGDTFDLMAGRYSSGTPNLGVYLQAHAGDTIRVSRRTRAEYVPAPALTIGLAVQPEVLSGLQAKPGFRGRGLLGRFLYALPASLVGRRSTSPDPVPGATRAQYERAVLALLGLSAGTDADGRPAPHVLTLTSAAAAEITDFSGRLEPRLAPGADLAGMTDWAAKLAGAVARLAGVLHCAEMAGTADPWCHPIDAATTRAAVHLGETYLAPHAMAAFGLMGADPVLDGARRVLAWLRDTQSESFTKRDAHYALQGSFAHASGLDEPLRSLEERGFIRAVPPAAHAAPGRKPSPRFLVHPRLTQLTELTQPDRASTAPPAILHSVNSVNCVSGAMNAGTQL